MLSLFLAMNCNLYFVNNNTSASSTYTRHFKHIFQFKEGLLIKNGPIDFVQIFSRNSH
jgi:hypothetical protein